MSNKKINYISIFLCVFFILLGITGEEALIHKINILLKLENTDKVTVAANNRAVENFFSVSDLKFIKNKIGGTELFAMSDTKEDITYGRRSLDARVLGVTSDFGKFYDINLSNGNFINEDGEDEFHAVIEDRLAYRLFGNENVEGLKIKILNKDFKIIGVVKRDNSIIQNLSEDGLDKVYIPLQAMVKLDDKAKISYLQFQNFDVNVSQKGEEMVINILGQIGKDSKQYLITDYSEEKKLLEQKPLIFCFVLGVYCIYSCVMYIKSCTAKIIKIFSSNIKQEYLAGILKKYKKTLCMYTAKISIAILSILILWNLIRFDLYITAKYIPDKLIDIAYYENILQDVVKESINNEEYLKPFIEFKFFRTNEFINVLNLLITISLVSLNFLIYKFITLFEDVVFLVRYSGICVIASILLIDIILIKVNLSIENNLKYWLIIWLFIFVQALSKASNAKYCAEHRKLT